jgi:hypothetical protein
MERLGIEVDAQGNDENYKHRCNLHQGSIQPPVFSPCEDVAGHASQKTQRSTKDTFPASSFLTSLTISQVATENLRSEDEEDDKDEDDVEEEEGEG